MINFSSLDEYFLSEALALAKLGRYETSPNPCVGCVIVKNNQIIGGGHTSSVGGAHAEINAITDALKTEKDLSRTTAYVTLEPCSHYGRTPPCVNTIIQHKIQRVVIGILDPNPDVSGEGVEKLKAASIQVDLLPFEHPLSVDCEHHHRGFLKRMRENMPWVTAKLGMSLDAKIAMRSGESKWITGKDARNDVQRLRAESCAILTSNKTVIADNPKLNVRLKNVSRQPKIIIIDRSLSVPAESIIFTENDSVTIYHEQLDNLTRLNFNDMANLVFNPPCSNSQNLKAIFSHLAVSQQCNQVLVEAGGRLVGTLISENLIDELVIYTAPVLLGTNTKSAFDFSNIENLAQAKQFNIKDCAIIGNDLKITLTKEA